jgi:hypothetical protein
MPKPWLPLVLSIAAFAPPTAADPGASCPYPSRATSYSEAYTLLSTNSGVQIGDPAVSSVSKGYASPGGGYSFQADSALTIGTQSFRSRSHLGGFTTLIPTGADGHSNGVVTDCLTFGGYQGQARAHIPIQLSGSAFVSWSSSDSYVPANIFDPAHARIRITCFANSFGSSTPSDCPDPDLIFDTTETIDTTVELVFAFSFDDPITVEFAPTVTANFTFGRTGISLMQAMVTLQVQGQLLPIYVTDLAGNALPNVSISATSSVDYLHPVPEPGAAAGAVAALAALIALQRSVRASR